MPNPSNENDLPPNCTFTSILVSCIKKELEIFQKKNIAINVHTKYAMRFLTF